MSRTDTAVRVISASPDRVFAALTDSDTLCRARLGIPKRDTGRRFRSDRQCERPARRLSLGLFVSIGGFSPDAVTPHSGARPRIILLDGADLWAILEGRIALPAASNRPPAAAALRHGPGQIGDGMPGGRVAAEVR